MMFDRIGKMFGSLCALFLFGLLAAQFAVVVGRYAFAWNMLWVQELSVYLHFGFIAVALPWAFLANRHIRIDVLSSRFSAGLARLIERAGFLILLVPMMMAFLLASLGFVAESWSVFEGSAEVSGLPGVFLIKSLLLVIPVLMMAVGLAVLVRRR